MNSDELLAEINKLTEWELDFKGTAISREFKFSDFKEAMDFANTVADLANAADHHPDMLVSWGKVVVTLSTHEVGGVSEKDLNLASKIDELV